MECVLQAYEASMEEDRVKEESRIAAEAAEREREERAVREAEEASRSIAYNPKPQTLNPKP